jgi:hypothetical protein
MAEDVYALDLDEELLSHLSDPESWVVIRGEGISPDLINDDDIREIFHWQDQHIRREGKPATASVLAEEFDLELSEPLTAIGDLLDRLRDRYMKGQGRKALRDIGEQYKKDPAQIPNMLIKEGRELAALLSRHGEMYGTGDFQRARHRYDQKVLQGPGHSFGFPEVDDYFFGQRGLTFMVAPPKTYKSWFMLQGLVSNVENGACAYLDSLELPAEESDMRLRCLLANVPWWHYLRNRITDDEWGRIKEASELIDGMGMYKIVKPPEGERSIDHLVGKARDAGADIVFIDQLQYVEGENGRALGELNDPGQYWGVLNRARNLSDDGPICIAHQFNRSAMFCDEMPVIQQAKGSSAIEETATLALGMWASKDMRRSSVVELGTLISRNSMFASWEMAVDLSRGCSFNINGRIDDE